MAEQITVTQEGLTKLQEELEYLKTTKRKEVVEAIRIARGFGDLSENSEYDEAKTEQGKTEGRIAELEEMLKNVIVVNTDNKSKTVNIGSIVKVHDVEFDEDDEYTIVGSTEADATKGWVSDLSPIGKALIGAKKGATVEFETPGGISHLKIMDISKKK